MNGTGLNGIVAAREAVENILALGILPGDRYNLVKGLLSRPIWTKGAMVYLHLELDEIASGISTHQFATSGAA